MNDLGHTSVGLDSINHQTIASRTGASLFRVPVEALLLCLFTMQYCIIVTISVIKPVVDCMSKCSCLWSLSPFLLSFSFAAFPWVSPVLSGVSYCVKRYMLRFGAENNKIEKWTQMNFVLVQVKVQNMWNNTNYMVKMCSDIKANLCFSRRFILQVSQL